MKDMSDDALAEFICTEKDHDTRAVGIEEYIRRFDGYDRGLHGVAFRCDATKPVLGAIKPVMFDVWNPKPYATPYMQRYNYATGEVHAEPCSYSRFVRVLNSTADEDGTFKVYYIKVPPQTLTPMLGVAWSFGYAAHGFYPSVET